MAVSAKLDSIAKSGAWEDPSNQAFQRVKLVTIVKYSNIFGISFWTSNFVSQVTLRPKEMIHVFIT